MGGLTQEVIVLYAGYYSIQDEKTGEVKEGVSVSYYLSASLNAIENVNGTVGLRPAKCTVSPDVLPKIKKAPALYNAEFIMTVDSKGKPSLLISDLEYISQVVIQPVKDTPDSQPEKTAKAG